MYVFLADLPILKLFLFSGKDLSDIDLLTCFLANHPYMSFIGLMLTENCENDLFTTSEKFVVTGKANERQILESLRRYIHRPFYIEKALYNLFRATTACNTPKEDAIKVFLHFCCRQMSKFQKQD
jgi:Zyg-11 family protein